MTRRFAEAEVRQLYEWWRDGELSSEDAARCLRVDVAEVEALFAVIHNGVEEFAVDGGERRSYYERASAALGPRAPALTTTLKGQRNG